MIEFDCKVIQAALLSMATPDLRVQQEFYQRLLGQDPAVEIANRYIEFRLTGLRLGIYSSHHPDFQAGLGSLSLCLQVTNLDAVMDGLAEAGIPTSPVRIASHGREIDLQDPDGNRIVIHQPSQEFWSRLRLPEPSNPRLE
ncbi:MAG: VOC family protein [Cyanobacteriota bacterium]|nr:VOC family protein [Cyanobacteriota bacterium]